VVSLALAVLSVEVAGASGAVFTARGLDGCYGTLQQPALAPPNRVFAPVWTVPFALVGDALWLVRRRAGAAPRAVRVAVGVFLLHGVFNIGWSAVLFGLRATGWGVAVIVLLWLLIVATIGTFDRVDRRAALLLVPYLLWVSFAAYLDHQL